MRRQCPCCSVLPHSVRREPVLLHKHKHCHLPTLSLHAHGLSPPYRMKVSTQAVVSFPFHDGDTGLHQALWFGIWLHMRASIFNMLQNHYNSLSVKSDLYYCYLSFVLQDGYHMEENTAT